jgi:hypothetical protein
MASTPLDILERDSEFGNGRWNGILRGYTRTMPRGAMMRDQVISA